MNHIYSLRKNRHSQQLQPVPETARAAGKGRNTPAVRAKTVSGALASVVLVGVASMTHAQQAPPPAATQLPQGGVVSRGSASIATSSNAGTALMSVHQSSPRAVIDWASFNVGSQAKVQFNQPSTSAVVLNNIVGNNASQIYGQISSNGQVFLSNPNGVYFSPTAQVDVGGLVATTGKLRADDFMAGGSTFERSGSSASVVNEGQLSAALGGYIALLAPEVRNSGVVLAQAGNAVLAAGEAITLHFNQVGTGLTGISTTPSAIQSLVDNRQAVLAPDGQIILSGVALNTLQAGVVRNSGTLSASSLSRKGGKVVLEGDDIQLGTTSRIEANGPQGGGTVLVGGDWQGSGDLRQATKVAVASGASIEANATQEGDGGKVVLWSDVHNASSLTQVDGRIEAKAAGAGQGGQVETSGHQLKIGDTAGVDTGGGQWLLDPANITISSTGTDTVTNDGSGTFNPNSGLNASTILANTIQNALASGDVTITTTNTGTAGTSAGSINVNTAIAWSSANKLTLRAAAFVYGTGNITTGSAGSNLTVEVSDATNTNNYLSGVISGSGSLTKLGSGTLILTGNNTYSGTTTISAGTLQIGATSGTTGTLGSGSVAIDANLVFKRSGTVTVANDISSSATGLVEVNTAGLSDIVGFSGTNSFTGEIKLSRGTLNLGSANAIAGTGAIKFGAGVLQYSALNTTDHSGRFGLVNGSSVTSIDTNGQDVTFQNGIATAPSGSNWFNKYGAGTLTVTGSSTYTGRTQVFAGTLQFGDGTGSVTRGSTAASTYDVTNGATLIFYRNGSYSQGGTARALNSSSGTVIFKQGSSSDVATISMGFQNAISVVQDGPGVLMTTAMGNATSTTGAWQINAGKLQIGNGLTASVGDVPYGPIVNNGVLEFNWPFTNRTLYNIISGTGRVVFSGSGSTTTLSGNNTYSGGTTLNAGTVILDSAGAIGTAGTITFNGGVLQFSANNTTDYSDRFDTAANQAYKLNTNGRNVTLATALSSSGGTLAKLGSGTLTLAAANSYASTTLGAGTLRLANNSALPDASLTISAGTALELGAVDGSDLSITGKTLTLASSGTAAGGGYLHNVAGQNTWSGAITLNNNSVITIDTGTSLNLSSLSSTVATNATTFLKTADGDLTFGKLTGSTGSGYVKSGSGVLSGVFQSLTAKSGVYIRILDGTGQYSSTYGTAPSYSLAFYTESNGGTAVSLVSGTDYSGTISYTGSPTTSSNVGNYSIAYSSGLTLSNAAYYLMGAGATTAWAVVPKPITVTLTPAATTYDGVTTYQSIANAATLTTTALVSGQVTSVTRTPSVTGVAQAGTFTITPSSVVLGGGAVASNYSFNYQTATATVSKAPLTVTANSSTVTYNGLQQSVSGFTASGLVNNESPSVLTGVTAGVSGKNATTYTATASGTDANYNLTFVNGTLTINKANLAQVTASKAYDGLSSVGFAQMGTIAGVNGETFTASAGTASISDANVATANKTLTDLSGLTLSSSNGGLGGNYNLSSNLPAAGANNVVTISRANLSQVTASKVYDGLLTVGYGQMGMIAGVNGESFTASAGTASISDKNVATANKTVTDLSGLTLTGNSGLALASNYNLSSGLPAAGTNNAVTISLANLSQVTASKVYDGLLTVGYGQMGTIAGVNGESFTASAGTASISDKNVATANKTVTDLSGLTLTGNSGLALASNYNLSSGLPAAGANNAVSISQAALTLAAVSDSKTYDGTTSSGVSVAVTGKASTDTVTAVQAFTSKNVLGTDGSTLQVNNGYTVVDGSNADMSGNYTISTATASGTINKANLTLAAVSDTKTYDGTTSSSGAVGAVGKASTDTVTAVQAFTSKNVLGTGGSTLQVNNGYTVVDGSNADMSGNYTISTATAAGTINKANLSQVTASKVYDGLLTVGYGQMGTIAGVNGESFTASAGTASISDKNVATANKTVTDLSGLTLTGNSGLALASNYNLSSGLPAAGANNAVSISQAALTLAAVSDSKTYDGTTSSGVSVAVTGKASTDTVTAVQAFTSKNVLGTGGSTLQVNNGYTVVDGSNADMSGNYTISTATAAGTINRANLTLAAVSDTKTYDGTTSSSGAVGVVGKASTDTVTAVQAFTSKNVLGTDGSTLQVNNGYTVVDGSNADMSGNYTISTTTAAGTINKANLTLAAVSDTKTYDGTTSSSGAVGAVGKASTDTVTAVQAFTSKNVLGTGGSTLQVNNGYTVVDGSNADMSGNYTISTTTAAGTINKANLSQVTASKVYDGLLTVGYGQMGTIAGVNGESFTASAGTASISDKNVATANKTVTDLSGLTLTGNSGLALASNYNLSSGLPAAGTNNAVTISLANLSQVTASKVYDGLLTVGYGQMGTIAGVNGESFTASAGTASISDKNVATANKTVTDLSGLTLTGNSGLALASNYNLSSGLPAAGANNAVSISQAALTLAAVSDSKTYDGTTSSGVSVAVTGKASTDTVTAVQAFTSKNVLGTDGSTLQVNNGYTVVDGSNADMSGNYTISTATASGTINKANLTLAAVSDTKTYDGTTSSSGAVGAVGKASTDTVTAVQAFTSKNVLGTGGSTLQVNNGYTVVDGSNADMSGNYTISTATAAGTINKANLSQVTASKVYDGLLTVGYGQMGTIAGVNGESFTASAGTASISDKNVATANKTVTDLSGLTLTGNSGLALASNYNLSSGLPAAGANNAVSISQAALTLAAVSDSKTYDGTTSSGVSVAVTGKASTDTVTAVQAFTSKNVLGTGGSTLQVNNGYTVVDGSNADMSGNYTISTATAAGTINRANLTLAAVSDTKTYDGTTSSSGAVGVVGKASTDTVTAVQAFTSKNVLGTDGSTLQVNNGYTVVDGSNADMSGNYTISTTTAAGTINKANLSQVTASKVYDGQAMVSYSQVATIAGVNGESFTAIGGSAAISDPNVATSNKTLTDLSGLALTGVNGGLVSNYNLASGLPVAGGNNVVTITPAPLTITALNSSKLLGQADPTFGLAYSGFVNGETESVLSGAGVTRTGSDTAAMTYNGVLVPTATSSNYTITPVHGNFTIVPADTLLVTLANGSKTYGASVSGLTAATAQYLTQGNVLRSVTLTPGANGQYTFDDGLGTTGSFAVTTSANATSGVGNYAITFRNFVKNGSNFTNQTSQDGNLVVNPLAVTMGAVSVSKTYDGNTSASANVAVANKVGADDVSVMGLGSYTDNKNVGAAHTYSVVTNRLTGTAASNYYLTSPTTLTGSDGVITPAILTIGGITANNKVYDGNTNAVVSTANVTQAGLVAGDVVTVSATGSFATKGAGTGKLVNLSSTYGGADRGNYTIIDQTNTIANITPAALTINGVTASNKVYDGTTVASLNTAAAQIVGLIGADEITVSATGNFVDKNVGNLKQLSVTGYNLGGTDGGNYTISGQTSTTANITPASLTISGITASDRVYDGTTSASVSTANVSKTGLVAGDVVNISATGSFADKNAGTGKTVNLVSSYSGADLGNYTITDQTSTTANITSASLTISGITASDKVYDGTTSASVSTANVSKTGLVAGDVVNISATGSFADKNAGTGKTVNLVSSYSGADLGNYAITDQTSTTANITSASLTISGITASDKVYDGTTSASVSTANVNKTGLVAGDVVNISATGSFANKNAGTGKTVNLVSSYSGADLGNYNITDQTSTTANIMPVQVAVAGVTAVSKTYDGNAHASLSGSASVLVIGSDAVSVDASGVNAIFNDREIGRDKPVSVSGYVLRGVDAGNYDLLQPAGLSADINAATSSVVLPPALPSGQGGLSLPALRLSATGTVVQGVDTSVGGLTDGPIGTASAASVVRTTPVPAESLGASSGDVSGNTAASKMADAGLAITLIRPADLQSEGLVRVNVPLAMVAARADVVIPLADHLDWAQVPSGEISVTLSGGLELPSWLKFVPQDRTLVATAMPARALPLQVMVTVGSKRYRVDIQAVDVR